MFQHKWFLQDEADDGAGKGGGAGSDTPKDDEHKDDQPDVKAQLELVTKSIGLLAQGMQASESRFNSFIEKVESGEIGGGKNKESIKDDDTDKLNKESELFKDLDLEQMNRKQFAETLLSRAAEMFTVEMKKQLGSVDEKIGTLAERFESKNASEQITRVASDNPDFWEWSAEIKAVLKDTPNLSVQRAYALVKSENPEKATKLKLKFNPEKKTNKSFIGLTPTSSKGGAGTGKKSFTEASAAAFDKVMSELGEGLGDENVA